MANFTLRAGFLTCCDHPHSKIHAAREDFDELHTFSRTSSFRRSPGKVWQGALFPKAHLLLFFFLSSAFLHSSSGWLLDLKYIACVVWANEGQELG
jgi:hypothetical protein